jgi:hypothetical protein
MNGEEKMTESSDLVLKRHAEEIVQSVMMSVIMKEHPSSATETVYQKLKVIVGEPDG